MLAPGGGARRVPDLEVLSALRDYGVPLPGFHLARSAAEAAAAAESIGFPVVLKVNSVDIEHKSDVGGVATGIVDRAGAETAYSTMLEAVRRAAPGARIEGVLVMAQVEADREVIVGVVQDATFGPVMMFGAGGVLTELVRDVAFRALPITLTDARELISETRAPAFLGAFRGRPQADIGALERLLVAVSDFASAHPELDQLDLNPVIVGPRGAVAVDVRMFIREQKEG